MRLSNSATSISIYYHDRRRKPETMEPQYLATVDISDGMLIVRGTYDKSVDADSFVLVYPLDGVRDVLIGSADTETA